MAGNSVRVFVDLNTLGFAAAIRLPYSLEELLAALPGSAAELLSWMPNITLDEIGFAFDPTRETFALQATAGIAGSANPSADVFLDVRPVGTRPQRSFALVIGLSLDTPIDLSATPLFGPMLDGITVDGLALLYASEDIPEGAPGTGVKYRKGFALSLTLRAGDSEETFNLTPATKKKSALLRRDAIDIEADVAPPTVQWFPVQKKFGPLLIDRIGIATPPDRFGLALDAAVTTTALNLVLTGFTATFPKADISLAGLRIDVDGIAVSFTGGALRIAGSLQRTIVDPDIVEYAGGLIIKAGPFGISAVGAFAQVEGAISLFVFGLALGPFGGPPAFFVTGIAAGFGYNRTLKLPAPDRVQEYPLILAAKNGNAYLPDPSPAAALAKMSQGGFVPPRTGSYWVAAGVKFTSFQLLDSFAVLAVEFGRELVIALLGISALRLPKLGPAYAYAELTLSAVLRPLDGMFQMTAFLTPNSFVIDRNCRLRGGFAFWVWFGPHEHAGDFVVTLGGYNPHYAPPKWYPQVPRLGFEWDVDGALRIRGGCYFALTPSCVMAGGALAVNYQSGDLAAWFNAYADFLIWWKPFWFDARVGVNIGARYTLSIGTTAKTFSVDLSADVELWGPPLAGKARVNWWVISFTITINGGARPAQDKVLKDWSAFAEAYLPGGSDEVCRPTAVSGLAQILERTKPDGAKETVWVLTGGALSLGFETLVPATRWIVLGGGAPPVFQGPEAGVYPLGSVELASTLSWQLRPHGQDAPLDLDLWDWAPQASNVPQSMWGLENDGRPQLAASVQPAMLSGAGVPNRPAPSGPPPVSLQALSTDPLNNRNLPLPMMPPIDGGTAPVVVDTREVIRDTVMAPATVAARDALVGVLNAIGNGPPLSGGDLGRLARAVFIAFPAAPMQGPLGSTGPRRIVAPIHAAQPAAARGQPRPATADEAAPHALRAMFHRSAEPIADWRRAPRDRVRACVLDGFASPDHRRLARLSGTGGRARTRLERGMTLVWDVPRASRLRLVATGEQLLRVAALDRFGRLCGEHRLDGAGEIAIPDQARRVVMSALDGGGGAAGWRGTSSLIVAAPQALLGEHAMVRPQSPFRARRDAEHGVASATAMARGNTVEGAPGFIETSFMTPVHGVVVVLRRDHPCASLDQVAVAIDDAAMALRLQRTEDDRTFLFYDAGETGRPCRVRVQPSAGWRPDGVLGFPVDCASLAAGRFAPAALIESPGFCEVEFR